MGCGYPVPLLIALFPFLSYIYFFLQIALQTLDMSSFLGPFQSFNLLPPSSSEADQRDDIYSARISGNYDHVAYDKRYEIYLSSILGSKSKEPNADQENRKCIYCSHVGHNRDECMLWIADETAFDEAEANRSRIPKCEMCKGDHDILDCERLASYKYKEDSKSDDEPDSPYSPKSPTYSSDEENESVVQIKKACYICYKEHDNPCPYRGYVPEGAPVSPFYPIICERCDNAGMDNSLRCPYCKMKTTGYVIQRINCMVCGKDMSPDCCPYGEFVGQKPMIGYQTLVLE